MTVTVFANQKGGVGKTMTTAGVAERLADRGRRVLVIDADPQANLTANLGVEVNETLLTLHDVLTAASDSEPPSRFMADAITHAGPGWMDTLGVVPSELNLSGQEQVQTIGREFRLRTALADILGEWDDVLIDCPPSLGQLTLNAMIAADQVVAVTEAAALSVEGLAHMVRTLSSVQKHYNPRLTLAGVAVNKFRSDRLDRAAWMEKLQAIYGPLVISPAAPEREIITRAGSASQPLASMGRVSPAVQDVHAAMDAIADRILGGDE